MQILKARQFLKMPNLKLKQTSKQTKILLLEKMQILAIRFFKIVLILIIEFLRIL